MARDYCTNINSNPIFISKQLRRKYTAVPSITCHQTVLRVL